MLKEFKTFSRLLLLSLGTLTSVQAEFTEVKEPASIEPTVEEAVLNIGLEYIFDRVSHFNPRVLFERESVARALEVSFQQRAALLPQISLFANQSRQKLGQGPAGAAANVPPFNSFGAGVEGQVSLFNANRYANFRVARLQRIIAEFGYEVAYQDILEQAVQLYFTVLRDMSRVEIIEGNLSRESDLMKLAKDQFDLGAGLKIDVTRAEVRMATQRRQLMEAETLLESSLLQLKALLDLDLDRAVAVDRSILEAVKSPPTILKYASMESMVGGRAELDAQLTTVERARTAAKAATWQRLPSLNLVGQWGYESETAFDDDQNEAWLVGIQASIPLFEGGRIAAEKREAKAAVRQQNYRLRELRLQIEREFKFAILDMESRYEQIEISRDEVRLGNEEVEQAKERYQEGLADNRELIDAQQRLADAEQSQLQAVYLYGLSRLSFARAIGQVERVAD